MDNEFVLNSASNDGWPKYIGHVKLAYKCRIGVMAAVAAKGVVQPYRRAAEDSLPRYSGRERHLCPN